MKKYLLAIMWFVLFKLLEFIKLTVWLKKLGIAIAKPIKRKYHTWYQFSLTLYPIRTWIHIVGWAAALTTLGYHMFGRLPIGYLEKVVVTTDSMERLGFGFVVGIVVWGLFRLLGHAVDGICGFYMNYPHKFFMANWIKAKKKAGIVD